MSFLLYFTLLFLVSHEMNAHTTNGFHLSFFFHNFCLVAWEPFESLGLIPYSGFSLEGCYVRRMESGDGAVDYHAPSRAWAWRRLCPEPGISPTGCRGVCNWEEPKIRLLHRFRCRSMASSQEAAMFEAKYVPINSAMQAKDTKRPQAPLKVRLHRLRPPCLLI